MEIMKRFLICLMFALPLAACDNADSTAEDMGESMDNAMEDAQDSMEEAGDDMEDAADDMAD